MDFFLMDCRIHGKEIDRIGFLQFLLQVITGGLVWVCADVYEKENAR
jgi:hypothetical protein|nr:MAG TPA: hypothetical protein [Caudoviricetes sp.]